jgi:uncharacterized protein with PIN domain
MADHCRHVRFICDDNLGKLARYLRVGGFDTLFEKDIDNSRLIQLSLDDRRHILTRDHRLIERRLVRYYFFIKHDLWPDQLRSVMNHFDLAIEKGMLFTRCLEDNAVIVPVNKEDIQTLVYPYTYEKFDAFRQCPVCKRVYWPGSHTKVMLGRLEQAGIRIPE